MIALVIRMAIETVVSMLATLSFSILFGSPRKQWVHCAAIGGICWLTYLIFLELGCDYTLSSFIATLALTCFCRFFSYYRRTPVTVFLIAAIFPLVPGAGIYYTAYYLFVSNFDLSLYYGMRTLRFAGAITLGILFGFSLPLRLFSWTPFWLKPRRNKLSRQK